MKMLILAGGLGIRMHPHTLSVPKPMLLVGNKPILERLIEHYIRCGFTEFVLAVGYRKEQIKRHFGDGSKWGIHIEYAEEERLLGTGGAIRNSRHLLGDSRFVCSVGDILTTFDPMEAVRFHEKAGGIATIVARKAALPMDYGVLEFDENFRLKRFTEKPCEERYINMGIYVLEPEIFKYIPDVKDREVSFEQEVVPKLLEAGEQVNVYVTDAFWMDVARPKDYELAKTMFPRMVPVEWVEGI